MDIDLRGFKSTLIRLFFLLKDENDQSHQLIKPNASQIPGYKANVSQPISPTSFPIAQQQQNYVVISKSKICSALHSLPSLST